MCTGFTHVLHHSHAIQLIILYSNPMLLITLALPSSFPSGYVFKSSSSLNHFIACLHLTTGGSNIHMQRCSTCLLVCLIFKLQLMVMCLRFRLAWLMIYAGLFPGIILLVWSFAFSKPHKTHVTLLGFGISLLITLFVTDVGFITSYNVVTNLTDNPRSSRMQ